MRSHCFKYAGSLPYAKNDDYLAEFKHRVKACYAR